jgi:molybdopterin/thiamine biosynthesis adenylyltransferase
LEAQTGQRAKNFGPNRMGASKPNDMIGHRITILKSLEDELKNWLTGHPDKHERGAIVLFRRIARPIKNLPASDRFIAVEFIKMEGDWVIDSSPLHFTINMRKFPEIYFRCEREELELGFVHNHPDGFCNYSEKDDVNEQNIIHGLAGCNGRSSFLVSLVLCENKWLARIRRGYNLKQIIPVRHVTVLSDKIEFHNVSVESIKGLERQEAAFGKPFNSKLQSLRIAVVGLGGTGSPIATLLARCGIGELILIDGDRLERSNMNRVRGYTSKSIGKKKAKSLKKYLEKLGLNLEVININKRLQESSDALDALSSADIIFGCTDDATGRDVLNQALYYYAQVLIDVGLSGFVDKDVSGRPYLRDHRGRVSCILPESGACLRCQRVIDDEMIKFEEETKKSPELLLLDPQTLEREFYIRGGGEGAPGVGPFTSASADNAVATLMNLINPFRKTAEDLRQDNIWIDFVHMIIHSNEPLDDSNCIYCRTGFLLLKKEEKFRLDMPALGKVSSNV